MRSLLMSAAIGLMISSSPALAENFQRTAKSGAEAFVYGSVVYTEHCTGGVQPIVRVTAQPSHGTAEVRRVSYRMEKGSACPGQLMKATVIVYRSKSGFRGTDTLRYERIYEQYSNGRGESWSGGTITVQVQ